MWEATLYLRKGELTLQKEARDWTRETSTPSPQASSLKPLVSSGVEQEAEECFLTSIAIAKKQQAKSLELRAVMSLARMWQQQARELGAGSTEQRGRNKKLRSRNTQHESRTRLAEAHKLLFEVYNWFTEGFDTKDLREAKVLLEELSQRNGS